MKKILAISGILLGTAILSGCGNKAATQNQKPAAAPSQVQKNNPAGVQANKATPMPANPAKTTDVDSSLKDIDTDLDSLDSSSPDPAELNDADFQN